MRSSVLVLLTALLAAAPARGQTPSGLSPAQKRRADMLISVFENAALKPQYAYIEDLRDGRGYTAGRAGFCSGTGDMLEVVRLYLGGRPGAALAAWLPRLEELALRHSASVSGLDGFPAAWKAAAKDPLFRAAQDEVSDRLYYLPALELAGGLGLRKDFSKIALYEAAIQHGLGDDRDGLPAMVKRASSAAKPPASGGAESAWLESFLQVRLQTLRQAADPATAAEWAASAGRAEAMLAVFRSGNLDFAGPVTLRPFGDSFTIP